MQVLEQIQGNSEGEVVAHPEWSWADNPQNVGMLKQHLRDLKESLLSFGRQRCSEEPNTVRKLYASDKATLEVGLKTFAEKTTKPTDTSKHTLERLQKRLRV